MAQGGRKVWRLRHTMDPKTGKWFNIFRDVDIDDENYKDTGTDEHGYSYYDTPIDWKRDWEAIKHIAAELPAQEFARYQAAAQMFQDTRGGQLAQEAIENSLFSKLRAKRRSMEAPDYEDPQERARQMRMAGAEHTAGDAWGKAIGRNWPKTGQDEAKTRGIASKYETLGLIQGMVNQEPGANTRMRTLEPLLVGYIRNATPEQLAELNAFANKGDLDSILNKVGSAANSWGSDPNMQQYAFASAANRYNTPNSEEDIAQMGGPAQQPSGPDAQQSQQQAPYVTNPQLASYPTGTNENYPNKVQEQTPEQQQNAQQQQPQPQQENQFTGPTGWAAPIQQQQQARQPQQQGVPQSATPGNFANTLGSFANQYGGGVLPSIRTNEPGRPPLLPTWGELLAFPNFESAYMNLFKSMFDRRWFFKQQAPIIGYQAADEGIKRSEAEYRSLLDALFAHQNKWRDSERMARRLKLSDKVTPPVKETPDTFPEGATQTEKENDPEAAFKEAYDFYQEMWKLKKSKKVRDFAQEQLKKFPDLRRKLLTMINQKMFDLFGIDPDTATSLPDYDKIIAHPEIKTLVEKLAAIDKIEDGIAEFDEATRGINWDDPTLPRQGINKPRTQEEEDYLRAKNTPHNRIGKVLKGIGAYGWFDKNRKRKLGFFGRPWLGIGRHRKKPEEITELEWKQLLALDEKLQKELGRDDYNYFLAHAEEFANEPGIPEQQRAYAKYLEYIAADDKKKKDMKDNKDITDAEIKFAEGLHRAANAVHFDDFTDFGGLNYGRT